MNRRQIGAVVIMAGGALLVTGGVLRLTDSPAGTETAATSETTIAAATAVADATTTSAIPTTSTTTTSTTTTTLSDETPEEFLAKLVQGLRGNPALLVSLLNQVTIDIYGAEQCLATFGLVLDPETELEIREIGEIGPWDYVIDDITTPLQNVIGVEVDRFVNGQTIIQELHWQLADKQWTWFSDCGDPLPG